MRPAAEPARKGSERARGLRRRDPKVRPIRIVVADERTIDRKGIVALLHSQPDLFVVAEAAAALEAVASCRTHTPDVLVLQSVLQHLDGVSTIAAVRTVSPRTGVLAIQGRSNAHCPFLRPAVARARAERHAGLPCERDIDCLDLAVISGALGAIGCSASPEDLFQAVRTVASGAAWYEGGRVARLLAGMDEPGVGLSIRDEEVAALIAEANTNKQIAQALGISEPTVKKHVGHILHKLGLEDRVQLALYLVNHPRILLRRNHRG